MKMETNLAFILYTFMVVSTSLVLIFYFSPRIGTTNVFVYVAASCGCSLACARGQRVPAGFDATLGGRGSLHKGPGGRGN